MPAAADRTIADFQTTRIAEAVQAAAVAAARSRADNNPAGRNRAGHSNPAGSRTRAADNRRRARSSSRPPVITTALLVAIGLGFYPRHQIVLGVDLAAAGVEAHVFGERIRCLRGERIACVSN